MPERRNGDENRQDLAYFNPHRWQFKILLTEATLCFVSDDQMFSRDIGASPGASVVRASCVDYDKTSRHSLAVSLIA